MANLPEYRPSHRATYYTWQRRFLPGKTAKGLVAASLLTVLGSFLYSLVQPQILSLEWRMGAVAAAAIAVGTLACIPVNYGRIRSKPIAGFVGAFLSFVALYAIWIVWLHNELNRLRFLVTYGSLISHPNVAIDLVRLLNQFGTWSLHGDRVYGPMLWAMWMAEAGSIVAAGVLIPIWKSYSDDPDCRECGTQCKRVSGLVRFAADRQNDFVSAIESRDFESIATHGPSGMKTTRNYRFDLYRVRNVVRQTS